MAKSQILSGHERGSKKLHRRTNSLGTILSLSYGDLSDKAGRKPKLIAPELLMKPEDGLLIYHTTTNNVHVVTQRVVGGAREGDAISVTHNGGMLVMTQKTLIFRSRDSKFISIKTSDIRRVILDQSPASSPIRSVFHIYRPKKRGSVIVRAKRVADFTPGVEGDSASQKTDCEEEITLTISVNDIDEEFPAISGAWHEATRPKKLGSLLETPEICKKFSRCHSSDDVISPYSYSRHR